MRLREPDWPGFLPRLIELGVRFSRTRLTEHLSPAAFGVISTTAGWVAARRRLH